MLDHLKNLFRRRKIASRVSSSEYSFKWYDPGGESPYPFRTLDCRPLTHTVVSATKDPKIAKSFQRLRSSDGRDLVPLAISDSSAMDCDLRIPHNGAKLEGIVFKADRMEVKWDIYVYDSVFLFSRSWTGELIFRAEAEIGETEIRICRIHAALSDKVAVQNVYFLLASHAMRQVFPHSVPRELPDHAMAIATYSFGVFGNRACFATFDDITILPITVPNTGG